MALLRRRVREEERRFSAAGDVAADVCARLPGRPQATSATLSVDAVLDALADAGYDVVVRGKPSGRSPAVRARDVAHTVLNSHLPERDNRELTEALVEMLRRSGLLGFAFIATADLDFEHARALAAQLTAAVDHGAPDLGAVRRVRDALDQVEPAPAPDLGAEHSAAATLAMARWEAGVEDDRGLAEFIREHRARDLMIAEAAETPDPAVAALMRIMGEQHQLAAGLGEDVRVRMRSYIQAIDSARAEARAREERSEDSRDALLGDAQLTATLLHGLADRVGDDRPDVIKEIRAAAEDARRLAERGLALGGGDEGPEIGPAEHLTVREGPPVMPEHPDSGAYTAVRDILLPYLERRYSAADVGRLAAAAFEVGRERMADHLAPTTRVIVGSDIGTVMARKEVLLVNLDGGASGVEVARSEVQPLRELGAGGELDPGPRALTAGDGAGESEGEEPGGAPTRYTILKPVERGGRHSM